MKNFQSIVLNSSDMKLIEQCVSENSFDFVPMSPPTVDPFGETDKYASAKIRIVSLATFDIRDVISNVNGLISQRWDPFNPVQIVKDKGLSNTLRFLVKNRNLVTKFCFDKNNIFNSLLPDEIQRQIPTLLLQLSQAVTDSNFWHQQCREHIEHAHKEKVSYINIQYEQRVNEAQESYLQRKHNLTQTFTKETTQLDSIHRQLLDEAVATYSQRLNDWQKMEVLLKANMGITNLDWADKHWFNWNTDTDQFSVQFIRIGQWLEKGEWNELKFPALIPFIGGNSLILRQSNTIRHLGIKSSRSLMGVNASRSLLFRLLASIPPGKLRLTFIDPVGLGQNVAPFMHLADYDEQLVTSKAWTEPNHIEQRLADLTEHMETVIQKYLRNQYATITEYNEQAGEVAEPYRVLVVYDFPTNFSEAAARRLVSIAQNGPRCGVYAIVLVDMDKPLPYGFNLADLEQNATVIAWNGERFVWEDDDFRDCILELDEPPPAELMDRIVKSVGEAAKNANKVEVPFERIIPTQNDWWKASSQDMLEVALGPSGARKFQNITLGRGTAQHVLVAGRTGSGKSNLINALITNLALNYSPQEVELYLIDFKKGVEFKAYATHQLPHARVIAIEGEREFGLSVLQGLDAELTRRAEPFKNAGVDSLADFRKKSGQTLSRILLLVDEFQEFFAEDDAIARQSTQILDRLVRQGRSFGVHVLLGSQTLAGAYTLARSTIDQMAVRIALQCSEADSRLILADDNPAARLLSRPGEAIYNAANGRVEGNSPFQVAMLNDETRERYLLQVKQLATERGYQPSQPQIIFEGNAPAEVKKNPLLTKLLNAQTPPQPTRKVATWLGDPIAIKEPSAAYFRHQSGSNLLIVGQNEEQALGMMESALISLAAQYPANAAKFYVVDFSTVDAPHAEHFKNLAAKLSTRVHYAQRRQLPEIINEIKAEVDRRLQGDSEASNPAIYLFIYGLQRARDLRPEEGMGFSSYSFGSSGDEAPPPNPAQQFPTILQEGPELGIHTLVWCDTVANLYRVVDRRALREFEMRIAFQMSADDSANLIDTPVASKLGQHRALFVSEEEGRMEKFRPYGLPDGEWLDEAIGKLRLENKIEQ